jgi:putative PIN family toxin of toxin-antitoxin system
VRVLLDSNVFVSALLIGRNCEEILSMGRAGAIMILSSEEILSEAAKGMRRKLRWREADVRRFSNEMRSLCTLVECDPHGIAFPQDPDDSKVLACAVAGKADVIVTGDRKHLLPLKNFRGIPILSPPDFLDRIG